MKSAMVSRGRGGEGGGGGGGGRVEIESEERVLSQQLLKRSIVGVAL